MKKYWLQGIVNQESTWKSQRGKGRMDLVTYCMEETMPEERIWLLGWPYLLWELWLASMSWYHTILSSFNSACPDYVTNSNLLTLICLSFYVSRGDVYRGEWADCRNLICFCSHEVHSFWNAGVLFHFILLLDGLHLSVQKIALFKASVQSNWHQYHIWNVFTINSYFTTLMKTSGLFECLFKKN